MGGASDLDAVRASLAARYGDGAVPTIAVTDTILEQLAHRSVRAFTPRDVGDDEVRAIVAAASSASTSSNQQWWSVIAVRDPAIKEEIRALAGGQGFIAAAPVFLVWIADLSRAVTIAREGDRPTGGLPYLETTITAIVDTALAAQNAAVAAESLGLGITFVGGVRNNPLELAALLGLPHRSVAVVGLAVGHPDPAEAADVRPRLPQSVVLHHDRYRDATIDELRPTDADLRRYFARFGRDRGWFDSVLSRIRGPEGLHGRHRIREQLDERGLSSR
jgi:nitroreductase